MVGHPKGKKNAKIGDGKFRVCLKCDEPFRSRGPGNRICSKCNAENQLFHYVPTYRGEPK